MQYASNTPVMSHVRLAATISHACSEQARLSLHPRVDLSSCSTVSMRPSLLLYDPASLAIPVVQLISAVHLSRLCYHQDLLTAAVL